MSTSTPAFELDIENPDMELSDEAIDALARLLVDAALQAIKEDSEAVA